MKIRIVQMRVGDLSVRLVNEDKAAWVVCCQDRGLYWNHKRASWEDFAARLGSPDDYFMSMSQALGVAVAATLAADGVGELAALAGVGDEVRRFAGTFQALEDIGAKA